MFLFNILLVIFVFQFWLDDIKPINKQVKGEDTCRML